MSGPATTDRTSDDARRARTRRLTLLLALVATGVYVGFIVLSVMRAKGYVR